MRSHSSSSSSSSKQQFNGSMEVEKPRQQDGETHLSGAYIRCLVKQLSSSRAKDNANPPSSSSAKPAPGDHAKHGELLHEAQQQQRPPGSPKSSRPQKKQVRRRLHTTRPYQEKLFNMAEARREIVAALKLHRASMKQSANGSTQQPHEQIKQQAGQTLASDSSNHLLLLPSYNLSSFFHGSTPPVTSSPKVLPWTCPQVNLFSLSDHPNLHLPDHPLGLNLDLRSFQNIDTPIYCNQPTPTEPSSPPASSLSCSNSSPKTASGVAPPVHLAVDEEEMAEIQSIGEQHDIEWNDRMNSATSAWWSKFLKSMEGGVDQSDGGQLRSLDEFLDAPSWFGFGRAGSATAKESSKNPLMQQHLDEYFRVEDYLESFDTGEIEYQEGGEWLP